MAKTPPTIDMHDDDAFLTAYERRLAGGRAEDVPEAWRSEIEDMVAIHARIGTLPLPSVSPAVRSAVLTAAAQAVEERKSASILHRIWNSLLRPGPLLVGATAAALLLAVGVRKERDHSGQAPGAQAVALRDEGQEPPVLHAPETPAPSAPRALPPEALPPEALAAETLPAPAAAPAPVAAEAPAVAQAPTAPDKAVRTIEAHPASLGPAEEARVAAKDRDLAAKAKLAPPAAEAQKLAEVAADEAKPQQAAEAKDVAGYQKYAAREDKAGDAPQGKGQAELDNVAVGMRSADRAEGRAVQRPAASAQAAAPAEESADKAPAPKETAARAESAAKAEPASKAGAEVTDLRNRADRANSPEERVAWLKKLLAAAQKAGDAKTVKWAQDELRTAEDKAANVKQNAKPTYQNAAPAERSKARSNQSAPTNMK